MRDTKVSALSKIQLQNTLRYVEDIIANLSDKALSELLGGYDNDIDALFNELLLQSSNIINFNDEKIDSERLHYLTNLEKSFDEQLKRVSYNYFKTTCLPNFRQEKRNLEWGNMIQLYPYLALLAARAHGKCFIKGTSVLMFDGSIKPIEDVRVGDELMGQDNTKRTVLSLHSGVDDMYEIEQKMFQNYCVNSKHDVYFKKWSYHKINGKTRTNYDESKATSVKMEARELYSQKDGYFHNIFGVGVNGWDLEEKELLIEPYWLGYWLGDGNRRNTEIATIDREIIDYTYEYAERLGLDVYHPKESIIYALSTPEWMKPKEGSNVLLNRLKYYNLVNNKHIPSIYLQSSRQQRLELLAGLIDSDGHNPKGKKNSVIFTQKSKVLSEQVQQLVWSLGFRCNITHHVHKTKATKSGIAEINHIHISGDLSQIPCKIDRKINSKIFKESKSPQRRGLRVKYKGIGEYYGFTCDKDHMFLLSDGTIVSNSYETCFALPLWKLYSYDKPSFYAPESIDNTNRKETLMITSTSTLGGEHLSKIVEEIQFNDIFLEKLNPTGKAKLGTTGIITETGSKLHLRGIDGSHRGLHCGSVIYDDVPNESSIYSTEQREKLENKTYGAIMPIVEPGGQFVASGTPFSERDIYWRFKQDNRFMVFEYPAIFPNGELLSPDRFTLDKLLQEKDSLGSLVFSREYLVVPISDDATIFPFSILMKSTIGMENVDLVDNIESYPFKLDQVVIGCDFAKSGNVGADYNVYTVWGLDRMENFYLLHIWRRKGVTHNEQISQIVSLDQRFKPNRIRVEANGFQGMLADLARERGLRNIEEFTTTGANKKNWYDGLPSLAALFERGNIKVPYKVGDTREKVDKLFGEFNSISFRPDRGTLESVAGHDDQPMSSYFAITDLRENKSRFRAYTV